MRLRIDFPQKTVFVLGVVLSIFGIASIIIAVIAFSEKIWGHYLGTGLWCGISMFLSGLSGVVAGQLRRPCAIKTYLIVSVISACLSAVMLVLSAGGLDYDSNFYKHSFAYKKYPNDSTSVIHIFSLCLAIFGFICSLTSVGVCIKYLFFQKSNGSTSNQSSREIDNLMCTSSEGRLGSASTASRTPLRERTFNRSAVPRESASIRTPLRESESLAATSSHPARFHSPRHVQSGHGNSNSSSNNNRHSTEGSRFLPSEQLALRREQPSCQDGRREHVDLPRRIPENDNGTPSSTRSDYSQNSYLAAVELMPAASTDFPPQYDDLTPNVFGEDELPPYEEVIRELSDSSEGELVSDVDLNQERYVNCPVVSPDPPQTSGGAVVAGDTTTSTTTTSTTAATAKDVSPTHRQLAALANSSLPPLPVLNENNKSQVQVPKSYSSPSAMSLVRPASACHVSPVTDRRSTTSSSMYAVAAEATTQNGNQSTQAAVVVAPSPSKRNPQGVTYHDFSGININRAHYQLRSPEESNSSSGVPRPTSQPKSSCEGLRGGDREYITLKDSYENCGPDVARDLSSSAEMPPIVSPNFPSLPPRLPSPTRPARPAHSPHHTEYHHQHHHHHHHHHHQQRSQNKPNFQSSLAAKCETAKVAVHRSTEPSVASESQETSGCAPHSRPSSHSDCSGVRLVPLPKEVLSSGSRSKHYNRNKREIILPAKEFDPLAASMKAAEKLSSMGGSPEKQHRGGSESNQSRSKHTECLLHKSENKASKSKEDKAKDAVLVCRPKARLECGKSGVIRYSSDRLQRKSSSAQAERLHQFRWSDQKKRVALPQKLPSSVRDWDTNEHSQQKIVAEFSPASIFQCSPNSQSANLMRMHDIKKVSPSLTRKSGGSSGVHSIGVSTNKGANLRDEIHVAPEEILNIRTKPDRDREGSAFVAPSSAAAEVRYVPRLFHKSPQKSRSLSHESSCTNNSVSTAASTTTTTTTTTNMTSGRSATVTSGAEQNDSDDHDDSEPLYSNEISSSCSTPSSLLSSGSSLASGGGREAAEKSVSALSADVARKLLLPTEQAYMNISEANTVVVPMARISPLTVNNKSHDGQHHHHHPPGRTPPLLPAVVSHGASAVTLRPPTLSSQQTVTALVAGSALQLKDNSLSESSKSCPTKSMNAESSRGKGFQFGPSASPLAPPPPLLSPSRHTQGVVHSVQEVPDSQERCPRVLVPATVDIVEILGAAESKKIGRRGRDTSSGLTVNLTRPARDNHTEQPVSAAAAAVDCNHVEVVEAPDQGRDEGVAAAAAAVANVAPQVNTAENKPMYSILL